VDATEQAATAQDYSQASSSVFHGKAGEQGIQLPQQFGLGVAFLPAEEVSQARSAIEEAAETERLRLLGCASADNPGCLGVGRSKRCRKSGSFCRVVSFIAQGCTI